MEQRFKLALESWTRVEEAACAATNITGGFVSDWREQLLALMRGAIALADTQGVAREDLIQHFKDAIDSQPIDLLRVAPKGN